MKKQIGSWINKNIILSVSLFLIVSSIIVSVILTYFNIDYALLVLVQLCLVAALKFMFGIKANNSNTIKLVLVTATLIFLICYIGIRFGTPDFRRYTLIQNIAIIFIPLILNSHRWSKVLLGIAIFLMISFVAYSFVNFSNILYYGSYAEADSDTKNPLEYVLDKRELKCDNLNEVWSNFKDNFGSLNYFGAVAYDECNNQYTVEFKWLTSNEFRYRIEINISPVENSIDRYSTVFNTNIDVMMLD